VAIFNIQLGYKNITGNFEIDISATDR